MANNCIVAGSVVCGGRALEGIRVTVELLDNNRGRTQHATAVTTDGDGDWVASFDVGMDIAEVGFARVVVHCPDGPTPPRLRRFESSTGRTLRRTLEIMFRRTLVRLVAKVIGVPVINPILSTDFVVIVANGGLVDCCRSASTPAAGAPGEPAHTGRDDARRAREAAERAEQAAREAARERQQAERERRQAEAERERARQERERAEAAAERARQERERAEAEAERARREREQAEEAQRRAQEALEEARRLRERRTRLTFDLDGAAGSDGRAGITVSGVSVVTDVRKGETARAILERLARMLRAQGFEVRGPERIPGTDQYVLYITADAAGEDPTGGGIGTLDVQGMGRLSAHRQVYCPALVASAAPGQAMVEVGKDSLAFGALEVTLKDTDTGELFAHRFQAKGLSGPEKLAEHIANELVGIEVSLVPGEGNARYLLIGSDVDSGYQVVAAAVERADAAGRSQVTIDGGYVRLDRPSRGARARKNRQTGEQQDRG